MFLPSLHRRHAVLAGLACGLGIRPAAAAASDTPPALLLAREANTDLDPGPYLVSEKLDGVRALWDGERLRFRGGGTVAAPPGFLAGLPAAQPLDGELWLGRGRFDALSATVRRERPSAADWAEVRYLVFELPGGAGSFAQRVERLQQLAADHAGRRWEVVPQERVASRQALRHRLATVVAAGGEGLMLHRADAAYATGRSDLLLKMKPVRDADGREFLVGSGLSEAQRASPPPLGTMVTYSWRGETATGLPRFPTLVRLHTPGW
jgi:DNA ligase-1